MEIKTLASNTRHMTTAARCQCSGIKKSLGGLNIKEKKRLYQNAKTNMNV